MASTKEIVDLERVQEILGDCVNETRRLDGSTIDDKSLERKPGAAEVNRRLLNLADQLALASALVRNEYWQGRGLLSYDI
jgi:hypothetical protein